MKKIISFTFLIIFAIVSCKKEENPAPKSYDNTCPPWNNLSWVKTYVKQDNGSWVDLAYGYPDMTDKISIKIIDNVAVFWYSYHTDAGYASNPDRTYYFQSIKYTENLTTTSELVGSIEFKDDKNTDGSSFSFDIYNLTLDEKSELSGLGANIKLTDGYTAYYMKDNTLSGSLENYTTNANLPIVTTSISETIGTKASCVGNVKNDANSPISMRGICWSINPNPTISDNKTSDGSGIGTFACLITGLQTNSTYYIRAYATNSKGTGYGNELSFKTDEYAIGQLYQGGLVAYILQPGDMGYVVGETHGLIAASNDQGNKKGANNTTDGPNSTGTAYGTGSTNTNSIVFSQSYGDYAAKFCNDLALNGYDDWFLPSKDELNILYINRDAIGGFNVDNYYWTSSVDSRSVAWVQSFNSGYQTTITRTSMALVRPVRYF